MLKTNYTGPFLEGFEQVRNTLPGPWLSETRLCAIRSFEMQGFPTPRTEEWKYTNLNPLKRSDFDVVADFNNLDISRWESLFVEGADRIVIVNGSYDADASEINELPNGANIKSLSEAFEDFDPELEGEIGKIAPTKGAPLVALNTAFMQDGVVVNLADGVQLERPVQILHLIDVGDQALVVHPRNLVIAGDKSSATVVETFAGVSEQVYWTNAVTEIRVGSDASIRHVKRQEESLRSYHTALTQVRLGSGSRYSSVSLVTGARLSRNETRVSFEGERAEASLAGGALLRGRQHADTTTQANHMVPHTSSEQVFRNVLDESSHSVFQGGVTVGQDAQKTDSLQSNRNLLLSAGAHSDSKPELKIFADDVKCAHGATVGELDKDALFYLQSRGIPENQAKILLIEAFIAEISDGLAGGPVGDHISNAVSDWMSEAAL